MISNETLLKLATDLVKVVGKAVRENADQRCLGEEIGTVGASGDRTKRGDAEAVEAAQRFLATRLESCAGALVDEETGVTWFGRKECASRIFVILDPVDGSNNMRAFPTPAPFVSTSVAVGRTERLGDGTFEAVEVGVVLDIFNDRLYWAVRGEGAYCERFGRIRCSNVTSLDEAIIGIDLDVAGSRLDETLKKVGPVLRASKCQRRLGSSILDFMKVASGEYDAFVSSAFRMKLHDIAAAKLIVEEAGGVFAVTPKLSTPETVLQRLLDNGERDLLRVNTFAVVACANRELYGGLLEI